jgi:hypothetical protein
VRVEELGLLESRIRELLMELGSAQITLQDESDDESDGLGGGDHGGGCSDRESETSSDAAGDMEAPNMVAPGSAEWQEEQRRLTAALDPSNYSLS